MTESPHHRPLRIACYGWVDRDGGSAVSGHFLVVEELLNQGHSIDFFAIQGTPNPAAHFSVPNSDRFQFCQVPAVGLLLRWHELGLGESLGALVHMQIYRIMRRRLQTAARRRHIDNRYDICLFLGRPPDFSIPGVPSVAWVQGSPRAELTSLWARRAEVAALRSRWFAAKVLAFRLLRTVLAQRAAASAKALICGSSWSRERLSTIPRRPIPKYILPYPVDLKAFAPNRTVADRKILRLVWLGRIEPRKRFPLLLHAIETLVNNGTDVVLNVYGRATYIPEYEDLARRLVDSGHVIMQGPVHRKDVPGILNAADILVQTSEAENFGTAVAEALSTGLPVVIGRTNGTLEYLPPCCDVFQRYDPDSVAKAITRVAARTRIDRHQTVIECRAAAQKHFSPQRVTSQLVGILSTLTQQPLEPVNTSV